MQLFLTTISRMLFLFALLAVGFLLVKLKVLNVESAGVLSRLENAILVPALVMGTFIKGFTVESLKQSWKIFLAGIIVIGLTAPLAVLLARFCSKDGYIRRIFTYGLAFSNFGFMGNAVVSALFPEIFADYLIFTLPFWALIQLWGVPVLLIAGDGEGRSLKKSLKNLCNPMMIGMLIGMVIGISGIPLPDWTVALVNDTGACMSPIAMILTGITVAGIDLKATLTNLRIYAVSALRLLAIPLLAVAVLYFLPLSDSIKICTVCSLAMPLGLNTVVIPAAYGRDTSVAAGMALISHTLSCATIPVVFLLLTMVL